MKILLEGKKTKHHTRDSEFECIILGHVKYYYYQKNKGQLLGGKVYMCGNI